MKEFNTEGTCIPEMHYMVDTSSKIEHITQLIDKGKYFTINRSRQYGKTTTISQLKRTLKSRMQVISISFEGIGEEPFGTNAAFVRTFIELCSDYFRFTKIEKADADKWNDISDFNEEKPFKYLSGKITELCEKYEIVLMIDEMDKCSANQVFLNFLGMLRDKYLSRNEGEDYTFKSVILAGVYDVKNLKLKLRPDEERKYNSPWNIAVDFTVDMSFHPEEIATMLTDYENDVHTGMDIKAISEELYHYTSGYPYLVSWICKWIEEQGERSWNSEGIKKAQKAFLKIRTPLMDDMVKNIEQYEGLKEIIIQILFTQNSVMFNVLNPDISLGSIFGILCEKEGKTGVSNIIFEIALYDYFMSVRMQKNWRSNAEKNQFIKEDGHLDMVHVLDRFQAFMKSEYREEDERFIESQGRLLFLCFLKPIINGTGFYYVEPETRTNSRMDIVVTYLDEEFIIELKIWRGDQYRKDGIKQLNGYLESREQKKGYLVSFSFLKNKEYTAGYIDDVKNEDVQGIEDRAIYEVTV
ncbi:MAG: AAA-like domain-containing protein [Oscillospiraceae bacterium]|nr:AAA-like domain-containing protein [Oscillospiraceae bacterium]